jgi:hypothetical protein
LVAGLLLALVATGVFAIALSAQWERWQRFFDRLPEGHSLEGCADEMSFLAGSCFFLMTWTISVFLLWPRDHVTR